MEEHEVSIAENDSPAEPIGEAVPVMPAYESPMRPEDNPATSPIGMYRFQVALLHADLGVLASYQAMRNRICAVECAAAIQAGQAFDFRLEDTATGQVLACTVEVSASIWEENWHANGTEMCVGPCMILGVL